MLFPLGEPPRRRREKKEIKRSEDGMAEFSHSSRSAVLHHFSMVDDVIAIQAQAITTTKTRISFLNTIVAKPEMTDIPSTFPISKYRKYSTMSKEKKEIYRYICLLFINRTIYYM